LVEKPQESYHLKLTCVAWHLKILAIFYYIFILNIRSVKKSKTFIAFEEEPFAQLRAENIWPPYLLTLSAIFHAF